MVIHLHVVTESGALLCSRLNLACFCKANKCGMYNNRVFNVWNAWSYQIFASQRCYQWVQSEIHHRLQSVYGLNILSRKKSEFGTKNLQLDKQSWMMIWRKRNRPRTSHTDDNCTVDEGFIKEDHCIKVHEIAF